TQTRALQLGSPAINAGDPVDCAASAVSGLDQRRRTRKPSTRDACDIGAYDTGGVPLQILYVKRSAHSDPTCAAASPANPFKTIAAALACASDGTTVAIGLGTFAGGFTVAHNVVLQGSGAGTVISDPSAPMLALTEVTVADGHVAALKTLAVDGAAKE